MQEKLCSPWVRHPRISHPPVAADIPSSNQQGFEDDDDSPPVPSSSTSSSLQQEQAIRDRSPLATCFWTIHRPKRLLPLLRAPLSSLKRLQMISSSHQFSSLGQQTGFAPPID